jgi:hypothetical protein
MIGPNVEEGKWSSSKLHLYWVAKETYIDDPSHDMEGITVVSKNVSFVFMLQIVQKSEPPSVNCYNLSVTDMVLFLFSIETQK